jgi:hypothetical protein
MERLARLTHRITPQKEMNGVGQLYSILGVALPEQADQMTSAWRLGQTTYSRALFRTLSSTCVECHVAGGPQSPILRRIEDKDLVLWSPIDRARYLRSLGFNDQAFDSLNTWIQQPGSGSDSPWMLEDAVYEMLSLETRRSGNQERLIATLKNILHREKLPRYFQSDLTCWIRDLETWAREAQGKSSLTPSSKLNRAKKHLVKARTLQESISDRSTMIWNWRAVNELYGALRGNLTSDQRGEALYGLGSAFETLMPKNQETLHERFYESCIRQVPHTPRSDLCYRKLERSVVAGYTGSSGTRIPESVRLRLLELWGMAFLKKGLELR